MNQTNNLACFVLEEPAHREEARAYFVNAYPGIVYHSKTDHYTYRGSEFDYFLARVPLGSSSNGYLLVDTDYPHNWLFSYGGKPEERWQEWVYRHEHGGSYLTAGNQAARICR